MSLAEGVSARVAAKFYASGAILSNAQPALASEPGAAGAQTLRRVSASLKLGKDTFQSAEVNSHRQITDFRHGTRRVTGSISGELSPKTYGDFFQAATRGTWSAGLALSETGLISLAADAAASTLTFGGGDPVAAGLRVGDIARLTLASDEDNNGKNFLILAFSNTSNRTVKVFPPPDTMSADTEFELTTSRRLVTPATGHVSRKCAIEVYNEDIDVARVYKECRVGGFTVQMPASGMATVEFPVMGRDMEVLEGVAAPYFTAPAPETTTGILAAVNGLLIVNGNVTGVVTSLNIQVDLSPSSEPVVGQNFVPEIFLGRANVTGQISAMFEDGTLIGNFTDEDEISVLGYLTTTNDPDSPAMTFYLPRIKLSDADVATSGEGSQSISAPFQALKHAGAPGIEATTIQIVDTEIA